MKKYLTLRRWKKGRQKLCGINLPKLLIERYQNINDDKLNFLSKKYNISYSILYVKTKTEKKVIYNDKNFKLVLN